MKRLVILTALSAFALAAQADEKTFTALDLDKDGKVSMEEAKASEALVKVFKQLDQDQDGFLSKAEMAGTTEIVKAKKDQY